MSRKRQSGGQNTEAPITNANIQTLQNQSTQLRAVANQKKANLSSASEALNAASTTFRNATAAQAQAQENASIKIKASQNANAAQTEKQTARNVAVTTKEQANTNYTSSVAAQTNAQAKKNAAQKALNDATTEEITAKTAADAAQVAKVAVNARVATLAQEITNAQAMVEKKRNSISGLEQIEAANADPSLLTDLRAWFDASKLTGSSLTSWSTPSTINDYKSAAPQMTGTAAIVNNPAANLNVVSVSTSQSLTLSPTLALPQFTLIAVLRHSGTNRNIILRGSDQSKTVYGFTTGKQDYFSIGSSQNGGSPADTNFDIHVFTLDSNRVATFFSNGNQIVQYTNVTQGFDGLSVNTGGFATSKSDAEIAEIMIYDRALTADERQKLEGLMARKWGLFSLLPQNHPYRNVYPDLLGVLSGGKPKRKHRKLKRKTRKVRKAGKRKQSRRR
jgi:hypothetical protein